MQSGGSCGCSHGGSCGCRQEAAVDAVRSSCGCSHGVWKPVCVTVCVRWRGCGCVCVEGEGGVCVERERV